jgi:hypothetical protein
MFKPGNELPPDPSIRILAVSYAGAVEGSKAAFHLGGLRPRETDCSSQQRAQQGESRVS